MFTITTAAGQGGPVVSLSGESDISTVGLLRNALDAQVAAGATRLTVDLSGLEFADSATIGVLLTVHRALSEAGGGLVLAYPQPVVARSLRLLNLDQLLPVRTRPRISAAGNESDAC